MPKVCPVCDTVYPDVNVFCPVDGSTLHVVDLDGGLVGSVVADRYLVTDLLGEGGMGKVYLARHVRLPQQAAIKVLRKDMVGDPASVARFNREASNASRIDDEHVARVYDFGETTGGTVYLAMEYVPGKTLREIVTKEGALEPRRVAELVRQIAQGLDAAHRLKIIHRDLKPDNILVVEGADGRDRAKVVDFGIAKAFGADGGNLTRTGFIVGTPEFMSPEQLMGESLDARSDVYALALVAFQCLTAALPFGGNTPEAAMTGRLTKAPKRLDEVSDRPWPAGLQAVFDAALSRDVEGRPATASEFARQMKAAIDAMPGGTGSAGVGSAAAPTPPRGATVRIPEVAAPSASAPAAKKSPVLAIVAAVVLLGGAAGTYYYLKASDGGQYSELAADEAMARGDTIAGGKVAAGIEIPTPVDSGPASPVEPAVTATPPIQAPPPAPKSTATAAAQAPAEDKAGAASKASERAPMPEPTPPPPADDPSAREQLDALSAAVARRGVDAASAQKLAGELRALAQKLADPALKARAYFRLIDASALSGDLSGACSAWRSAKGVARGGAQLAELRKYEEQLGCS